MLPFFLLAVGCQLLVLQCVALVINAFNYDMPWHSRAFRIVFGSALGIFAYVIAVLSIATLVQGVS